MKTIGIIFTGLACAAAGFGVGMYVTKKRYEQIINKEVNDSVAYFKEKYETLREAVVAEKALDIPEKKEEEPKAEEPAPKAEKKQQNPKTVVNTTIDNFPKPVKEEFVDYTKHYKSTADMRPKPPTNEELAAEEYDPPKPGEFKQMALPWVIDEGRFEGEVDEAPEYSFYEKNDWNYYEVDQIFTDEYGDIVVNGMDVIGQFNLDKFDDDDEMYIRNDDEEADYRVTLIREAYYHGTE